MNYYRRSLWFSCIMMLIVSISCSANTIQITPQEQSQWVNWLLPLPKQITILQKATLPAKAVYVQVSPNAGDVEKNAASLISDLFHQKANVDLTQGTFMIRIGLIDQQGRIDNLNFAFLANQLKQLPNADQAYSIQPVNQNMLLLTALDEKGLFHGVQTLRQLLEPAFGPNNKVSIPLATVIDWPDIEQRGFWEDGFTADQIKYIAAIKYNTVNVEATPRFDEKANPIITKIPGNMWTSPSPEIDFTTFCHLNAVHCVPYIIHLSHLGRTGIYNHYPELEGKGESAQSKKQKSWMAPCTSNPKFAQILAGWMSEMANYKYVDEISVWMTEDYVSCGCDQCRPKGEYVAQTLAITNAWRLAQKTHPDLKLQLLLTQGSHSTNDKVLAAAPKDTRIIYYDGGRSYDSSREPMIYPLLENYAKKSGWLGVYPQVTVSWAFVMPWSCPQFIKARMVEYTDKKLNAVIGYATPSVNIYDFNVSAAAEWAWNAHGRNEWQFACAWATRKGFNNPQAVADWAVTLGPASWNLYGSSFPYKLIWFDTRNLVRIKMEPQWGTDIFRYFSSPADLDQNILICSKALALAEQIGQDELIEETQITLAYYTMLKSISQIMTCVAENQTLDENQHHKLDVYTRQLKQAAETIDKTLAQWSSHYKEITPSEGRLKNTIKDTYKIEEGITSAVNALTPK